MKNKFIKPNNIIEDNLEFNNFIKTHNNKFIKLNSNNTGDEEVIIDNALNFFGNRESDILTRAEMTKIINFACGDIIMVFDKHLKGKRLIVYSWAMRYNDTYKMWAIFIWSFFHKMPDESFGFLFSYIAPYSKPIDELKKNLDKYLYESNKFLQPINIVSENTFSHIVNNLLEKYKKIKPKAFEHIIKSSSNGMTGGQLMKFIDELYNLNFKYINKEIKIDNYWVQQIYIHKDYDKAILILPVPYRNDNDMIYYYIRVIEKNILNESVTYNNFEYNKPGSGNNEYRLVPYSFIEKQIKSNKQNIFDNIIKYNIKYINDIKFVKMTAAQYELLTGSNEYRYKWKDKFKKS